MLRKPQVVGKSFPRVEGQLKLTGAAQYVDDLQFGSEVLYAQMIVSTHAHARILGVDVGRAKALAGVHAVLTGQETPHLLGLHLKDRPVLAGERVRHVGEPVAAVAAETPELAAQAAALVAVAYEPLPAVFDVEAALAVDAPLLHPELLSYDRAAFVTPQPQTNIATRCLVERGDMAEGWADASVIIAGAYRVPHGLHAPLETHGAAALADDEGRVTLWASTQSAFTMQQMICAALGLTPDRLRVLTPFVGGGFGGKTTASIEAIVVALALKTPGRPVKLTLTREQEAMSTFIGPSLYAQLRMGVDNGGQLTAVEAIYHWDCGASGDASTEIAVAAALVGAGPYRVRNARVDSYSVYTNHPPVSPVRGLGIAELHWAIEQHIDRVAEAIGMDPVTFRLRNSLKGGDEIRPGQSMHANGLHQCIRRAAEAAHWKRKLEKPGEPQKRRGRGLAALWAPTLLVAPQSSAAFVRVNQDATCSVGVGGVDAGQGAHTLAVQLAATGLGVPLEWVHVLPIDTERSPVEVQTISNHLSWSMGNAVLRAAQDAKGKILAAVAESWQEPVNHLDMVDGVILSYATERTLRLTDFLLDGVVVGDGTRVRGPIVGENVFAPALQRQSEVEQGPVVMHYCTGAQAVEVEVDTETGEVSVLMAVSAFDVGHAINPDVVRSQIKGGLMYGLGTALSEEVILREGVLLNPDFREYHIPTLRTLPLVVEPILVEVPQDDGPYGARGVGEHAHVGVAPAVANAIANALGVRVTTLPMTPQRVWEAIQAGDGKSASTR